MARARRTVDSVSPQPVAGNGLLDRRLLLKSGMVFAGAMTTGVASSIASAAAEPLPVEPWSKSIGVPPPPFATPSGRARKGRTGRGPAPPRPQHAGRPPHPLDGQATPPGAPLFI